MDAAGLAAHLCRKIERSCLVEHPFDHVVVDDLLPSVVLAALLDALPATEFYTRPERPADERQGGERAIICSSKSTVPDPLRSIIGAVDEALCSRAVIDAWLDMLRVPREESGSSTGSNGAQVILSRDIPPYEIGPHTDVPRRIASGILYLSPADAPAAWGTTFFRPANPQFECSLGRHFDFDGFVPVTTIPFQPNRAVVFRRSNRSFHGLQRITGSERNRDVLLYEIVRDRHDGGGAA